MAEFTDIEWLVHNRSEIQNLMLLLLKNLPEGPTGGSKPKTVLQLLVGVTFSLWRAAFLAESARNWQENATHAKNFLEKVVKDNAIGYSQKRDTKSWTVGYYLNSAFLRLDMAYKTLEYDTALRGEVRGFLEQQIATTDFPADPKEPWELANRAAYELLHEAQRRLTRT